jgi:BioD-like phosphotransacetylase family protein
LAKQYGKTELELTLMYALKKDTLRVKSIKSIIDKRLYLTKSANNNNISSKKIDSLFNNHSNIRGAKEYK